MTDIILYNLLHNSSTSSKTIQSESETTLPSNDPIQIAFDKAIDEHVDSLIKEGDQNSDLLTPISIRRDKLKNEILEAIDLPELFRNIALAINILKNEGSNYLSKEEYESLLMAFNKLNAKLEDINLQSLEIIDNSLIKENLSFPIDIQSLILRIGITKFSTQLFSDSLALFAFLTLINSDAAEYWYRLGLAAQQLEQYELAANAYVATSNLIPDFIGARIFATQCFLKINQTAQAQNELAAAKNIQQTSGVEKDWIVYLEDIENLMTFSK